jgi:hypothetical protein
MRRVYSEGQASPSVRVAVALMRHEMPIAERGRALSDSAVLVIPGSSAASTVPAGRRPSIDTYTNSSAMAESVRSMSSVDDDDVVGG